MDSAWHAAAEPEQQQVRSQLVALAPASAEALASCLGGKDPYGIFSDTILQIGESAVPFLVEAAATSEYPHHAQAAAWHAQAISGKTVPYREKDGTMAESQFPERLKKRYLELHRERQQ